MAALVTGPSALRTLNLSRAGLAAGDMAAVLQHWAAGNGKAALQQLSLADNTIGDGNAQLLCTAVLANRSLKSLNLCGCHLGSECGRKLAHLAQTLQHAAAANGRRHSLQVRGA